MRPAGRGEFDSLYFDYPHFDPPRRRADEAVAPVAIVGAGPVGMIAALTLARRGVSSVLLDAKATFNDGSRAICISRSSFHILDSLGVVEPFLDKALGWTTRAQLLSRPADPRIRDAGRPGREVPPDVQHCSSNIIEALPVGRRRPRRR